MMLSLIFTILALVFCPHASNFDFVCTHAVFEPGTFIGCEDGRYGIEDETAYAGLTWIDGVPSLVTGP